ncbi:hypothetical protein [Lutibacter sp.]|uniref:hypothetical protein n=1 Tax=Lutibacter sp. TaxID=1925666 RepID=UPI001A2B056F|nr:hypothetical protein [Lutibacter sp.]MBI9041678.1 hypothetical protein [Lutibacter sp.]
MSYTRNYRERIAVHYSGSVSYSYPASQNGGSGRAHFSGTEYEEVDVHINVDTNPFDNSVENCNRNVNLLTGAVVATEAAQLVSIDKNSKKVASTIISGFFGYIRSEISQQVAELSQNIDAQLMHLKELAHSCLTKKKQMEGDFNRISNRYIKIFDDLNNELSNRIHELDKPTFVFKKETDAQSKRTSENDLVNTAAILSGECGDLHTKISTSIAKKRALDTLNQAKVFLWQQKKLNNTIQRCMLNENFDNQKFSPVCFIETNNEKNQIAKNLFTPTFLTALQESNKKSEIIEHFAEASNSWSAIPKEYNDNLNLYFNSELNKSYSSADQHAERVKEMIQKIANLGSMKVINFQKI